MLFMYDEKSVKTYNSFKENSETNDSKFTSYCRITTSMVSYTSSRSCYHRSGSSYCTLLRRKNGLWRSDHFLWVAKEKRTVVLWRNARVTEVDASFIKNLEFWGRWKGMWTEQSFWQRSTMRTGSSCLYWFQHSIELSVWDVPVAGRD